jgi:hypothetical protein
VDFGGDLFLFFSFQQTSTRLLSGHVTGVGELMEFVTLKGVISIFCDEPLVSRQVDRSLCSSFVSSIQAFNILNIMSSDLFRAVAMAH